MSNIAVDINVNPIGVSPAESVTVSSTNLEILGELPHEVLLTGQFSVDCNAGVGGIVVASILVDGSLTFDTQVNNLHDDTGTLLCLSGVLSLTPGAHRLEMTAFITNLASVTAHHRSLCAIDLDTDERCVENLASLRALPGGVASCITVLGYYGPGDGGGGAFFWDPASGEADDGGIVIKPASVTGAGRWRRVCHQPVNVLWFGAVPYTTAALAVEGHDSLPALNAAVQSAGGAAATGYDLVGEILIPGGFYRITAAWRVTRPIKVRGEGRENGTTLVLTGGHFTSTAWQPSHVYHVGDVVHPRADAEHMFKVWQVNGSGMSSTGEPAWPVAEYGDVVDEPADVMRGKPNVRWKYIGLNYHSGIELETPPPPHPSANYSTISDLNLYPYGGSNIAIRANASNVVLDNIFVINWGLYGFCIDGTSESEPSGRGNANTWRMISCKADGCGTPGQGAGLFIRGTDSNAGCSVGFSALASYEGIRDHSFLGNYHYGAHVEDCPSYPYWTVSGGVQQSLFLGCY